MYLYIDYQTISKIFYNIQGHERGRDTKGKRFDKQLASREQIKTNAA